ncbi:MAG TPA: hypothetical protein VLC09_06645, partial [Polyangiaceae bacterium]|nr:hypothetical protein [Polyangiaceae bacterium]
LPIYGDGPPPPGYVVETQANSGLIIGGLVSFGTIYGASIIYGAANGFEQGLGALAVPILGPWLAVAGRDFSCDYALTEEAATACQEKTIDEAATLAVLSGLGIGQLIGATFTLVGVLDRDALWVRADAVGARFRVDSMSVAAGSGVRVFGEF